MCQVLRSVCFNIFAAFEGIRTQLPGWTEGFLLYPDCEAMKSCLKSKKPSRRKGEGLSSESESLPRMDCRCWCWEREGRVLRWTAGSERAAGRAVPWRPSCGLLARSNIHLRAGRGSRQDSTTSALLVGFGFVIFDLACSLTEGN